MKTVSKRPVQPFATGMRPELALLLCCARTKLEAEHLERTETLLRGEIDWHYLIDTAHTHGVLPLVTRNLLTMYPAMLPKAITGQLQRRFHANAFHNRFLARELLKLLKLFEAQGIPCIPYKGPSLAIAAYRDLSLRQFSDLDIWIHPRDILRAKALLISQGYQPESISDQEAIYLQSLFHLTFLHADGRISIELHWAITWRYWPFPLDFEGLWARLGQLPCDNGTIPSLPPDDLLLILSVHGSKHFWERLLWICDVAELVQTHRQIDWQRLLEQAGSLGGKRMLLLGLFLANDLLGTDLPEVIRHSIEADPRVTSLARQLSSQILTGTPTPQDDQSRPLFYRTAFYLGMRERLRDKVQFFVRYPFRLHLPALPIRLLNLLKRPSS